MSTLDVVNHGGVKPANFLDIGGGANADVMAGALEVINNDPSVKAIFINIFGGITRGEEVANGIVEALSRVTIDSPIVIRRRHQRREVGRSSSRTCPTSWDAAHHAGGRQGRELAGPEAISGLTRGQETPRASSSARTPRSSAPKPNRRRALHGLLNRDYGTQVVAAPTPRRRHRRGRIDLPPRWPTPYETGANAGCISSPPRACARR